MIINNRIFMFRLENTYTIFFGTWINYVGKLLSKYLNNFHNLLYRKMHRQTYSSEASWGDRLSPCNNREASFFFVNMIIHCHVLNIIWILVSIIEEHCSWLIHVDSTSGQNVVKQKIAERQAIWVLFFQWFSADWTHPGWPENILNT